MDKDKKLFPQRLWDLVHDERYNHFLRWSDDGQRVYLNRNDFEEQYLRTPLNQFHTQKAISFVRQMNMYGFKKVDDCHYENDHFKRGCHHLIKHMVRRNSNRPHMTNASLALTDGQSINAMRGSLIRHDVSGSGSGTSDNHSSSINQRHHVIGNTMMSGSGRLIPHEGLFPAACRQIAGGVTSIGGVGANSTNSPQHMTTVVGGCGGGGLDESQNNNLRALYEQLVSLNQINATTATQTTNQESAPLGLSNSSMIQQLVRSSAQLNNFIDRNRAQTIAADPITGTTPPLPTTTTATTTPTMGTPSIAHSSLASSLYQRLALPAARGSSGGGGYSLGDSCPITATTTLTTTLSAPHIQYASARGYNETAAAAGLGEAVRSMLATQNLVEAANRDAQLMAAAAAAAASAAATQQSNRHDLVEMTMSQTRNLAAQQLLQQTLIGSLMQLRLAPQLSRQQASQSLSGAASIAQNYQDLNFLLNQNQNLSSVLAQAQQAEVQQNQNSIGLQLTTNDVRMDEGTSERDLAGRSPPGVGGGAATASCSSSSSSSSSNNTSSRSSTSLNLNQSVSNEMLRRISNQCLAHHLPGCSGGGGGGGISNVSRSLRDTGGESDSECPLVTDDDDEFDVGRGPPSQSNSSKENTFQFGQQQQHQSNQARPVPSPAHCMSRRQLDGALINLSCGNKRQNRSV